MIDTDEFGTFFNPGAYDKLTKYKKRQFKLNENVNPAMVIMYVYPRLLKKLAEIDMIDDYDEVKRILSDCMIQYAL